MTPTIELLNDSWVKLSPNPVKDWPYLEFEKDLNKCKVEIYDIFGQLKGSHSINSGNCQIDVSGLPIGTYFILLKGSVFSKPIKFIKS